MGLKFSSIEGQSKGYYAALGVLVLLSLLGSSGFMISYIEGHRVLGSNNLMPWGMTLVVAIYLIGLSAGSLILSSLTYVFGKEAYRPISRIAVYLALVLIFGAMIAIVLDLGRPEKSWRLFMFFVLNNMRSLFAINGILYGGYFAISLVYLGLIFAERQKYCRWAAILAMGWAALVHMGTGAIFGFVAARPIFYSPLKPFEFLAAAMVSGLALLIIVVVFLFKFTHRPFDRGVISSLGSLLVPLIIGLFAIVFIDKLTHLYPSDREPTLWLMTGPFSWIFWVFQVGCAYVLPLLILIHPRFRKRIHGIVVAAFLIVIGIFGERFVLVIPGAAYPLPVYPGQIEGVWGKVGIFHLTLTDSLISVGLFGLMGLLFLLGLRYLELMPFHEAEEPKPAGESQASS